jgi:hypothetical protein
VQIFRDGDVDSPSDYEGPRDAAGIVSYLKKQTAPASEALATEAVAKFIVVDGDEVKSESTYFHVQHPRTQLIRTARSHLIHFPKLREALVLDAWLSGGPSQTV